MNGPPPFIGIERLVPRTVRLASTHKTGCAIINVRVIHRVTRENFGVRLVADGVSELRGTKVVVERIQAS